MVEVLLAIIFVSTFMLSVGAIKIARHASPISLFIAFFTVYIVFGYNYLVFVNYFFEMKYFPEPYQENITETTLFVVMLLNVFFTTVIYAVKNKSYHEPRSCVLRPVKLYYHVFFIIAGIMSFVAAINFNTIAPGAANYTLPLRLNGVVLVFYLYLIPFYIALLFSKFKYLGLIFILSYGIFSLVYFGSKYAAILPMAIYFFTMYLIGRFNIRGFIIPLVLIVLMYTMINPYYFRHAEDVNMFVKLALSYESAHAVEITLIERLIQAGVNFTDRLVGVIPLQWAVNILESNPVFLNPMPDPHYYINAVYFQKFGTGGTLATGFIGFIFLLSGSVVIGMIFSCFAIIFFLMLFKYLSQRNKKDYIFSAVLLATFIPVFLDGAIDFTRFLQIAFASIGSFFISKYLFVERKNEKYIFN